MLKKLHQCFINGIISMSYYNLLYKEKLNREVWVIVS